MFLSILRETFFWGPFFSPAQKSGLGEDPAKREKGGRRGPFQYSKSIYVEITFVGERETFFFFFFWVLCLTKYLGFWSRAAMEREKRMGFLTACGGNRKKAKEGWGVRLLFRLQGGGGLLELCRLPVRAEEGNWREGEKEGRKEGKG